MGLRGRFSGNRSGNAENVRSFVFYGSDPCGDEGFFFASNEPKSVLARDLGDCRENLENSQSEFSKSSVITGTFTTV